MSTADTKTTILDAAEALFAEHGFVATSLRQLTTRAGVNLAAVNYHFGSKDELARAVLLRRIAPVNAERRRRLDALPQPATVEHVVRAFVEPVLRAGEIVGGENRPGRAADWCRLFGRINVEQPPFLRAFLREQFGDLARRFVGVLREVTTGLDEATIWWRLQFMVGSMAHTLQNAELIASVSGGGCDATDTDAIVEQLVAYCTAGFATAAESSAPTPKRGEVRR
jgi:AcrR family transcriptional regulator